MVIDGKIYMYLSRKFGRREKALNNRDFTVNQSAYNHAA